MLRHYIQLSKPGIIMGNVFAGLGGFLFAAGADINITLLLSAMIGLMCIIASACAFNNVIDQDIDRLMQRTKNRALITGAISAKGAMAYGTIIGILGFALLFYQTSVMAFYLGAFAWLAYVVLYSLYGKRTIYGTFSGTFSGAVPPVLGYTAVTNTIDIYAILLYLIYAIWQMPHSYAIAIFRRNDYQSAGIPVLPLVKGFKQARRVMGHHIFRVILTAGTLAYISMPMISVVILMGLSGWWLYVCLAGYDENNTNGWGRQVFYFSLYFTVALNILLMVNYPLKTYLPF